MVDIVVLPNVPSLPLEKLDILRECGSTSLVE